MSIVSKLLLASALALSATAPVLAQQATQPHEGDYYAPTNEKPAQVSPQQSNEIRQGDYYRPSSDPANAAPVSPQQQKEGDYYKPESGR